MIFQTNFIYTDRESKARYVWLKYNSLLKENILDVGADEKYLKSHLDEQTHYWGLGLGGSPDQQVDLEEGKIPFDDSSFDCVLCLDVLEHLENIHGIFDELCRVSKQYVIISLPNPYANFWNMLLHGHYKSDQALKFYGLPVEKPEDRHRWFFSINEAQEFIKYKSKKNNMDIVQIDVQGYSKPNFIHNICQKIIFKKYTGIENLYAGALWAVLEKNEGKNEHQ